MKMNCKISGLDSLQILGSLCHAEMYTSMKLKWGFYINAAEELKLSLNFGRKKIIQSIQNDQTPNQKT